MSQKRQADEIQGRICSKRRAVRERLRTLDLAIELSERRCEAV